MLDDLAADGATGTTGESLTDDRLAALPIGERERYRDSLASGAGYTDHHRAILVALHHEQRKHRNRPGGYRIAEADPAAAHRAVTSTLPTDQITWAVLASDGAADTIAHHNAEDLDALLQKLHQWEDTTDPDGQLQPRAKRHDDETLAAIPTLW